MKKLYTLLAVAACAASASAINSVVVDRQAVPAALDNRCAAIDGIEYAPSKAAPVNGQWNVVGTGTAAEGFLYDAMYEMPMVAGQQWEITIEQSASDANWYRTVFYNDNSPIVELLGEGDTGYFYFNIGNPQKVYSDPYLVGGGEFTFYQRCKESGLSDMVQNPAFAEGHYGKYENGVISFEAGTFAYHNKAEKLLQAVDKRGDLRIALPGTVMPAKWQPIGMSVWEEAILAPFFTAKEVGGALVPGAPLVSDVMVERSVDNANIIRIVTPWLQYYESHETLVIDLSNPKYAVIDQQPTGFVDSQEGPIDILSASANVAPGQAFTETAKMIKFDAATNVVSFPANCCYVYYPVTDPEHVFTVKDELAFAGALRIGTEGGVGSIVVEDTNAAPEYFNLQGIRVANPESGLYIVRRGNKVSKELVR